MAGFCVHMNGEAASPRFLKLWLLLYYSTHLHGIWHDWSIVDLFGDILKCLVFFEVFFIWKYIKILYNFLNIIVFGQSGNSEYSLFPCPTLKIGTKNEHLPTDIHDSSTYSQGTVLDGYGCLALPGHLPEVWKVSKNYPRAYQFFKKHFY